MSGKPKIEIRGQALELREDYLVPLVGVAPAAQRAELGRLLEWNARMQAEAEGPDAERKLWKHAGDCYRIFEEIRRQHLRDTLGLRPSRKAAVPTMFDHQHTYLPADGRRDGTRYRSRLGWGGPEDGWTVMGRHVSIGEPYGAWRGLGKAGVPGWTVIWLRQGMPAHNAYCVQFVTLAEDNDYADELWSRAVDAGYDPVAIDQTWADAIEQHVAQIRTLRPWRGAVA